MESATVEKDKQPAPAAGKLELQLMPESVNRGMDNPVMADDMESPLVEPNMEQPLKADGGTASSAKEDPCSSTTDEKVPETATEGASQDKQRVSDVPMIDIQQGEGHTSHDAPGRQAATNDNTAGGGDSDTDLIDIENDNTSDCSTDYGDLWEDDVEEKYLDPSPHAFFTPFRRYLAKVMTPAARKFLSNHLNQDVKGISSSGLPKDWHGLAECMGKDYAATQSFNRFKDPTGELIKDWQTESGSTLGKLLHYLHKLDRYDVLHDVTFMDMIHRSIKIYEKEREEIAKEREQRRIERRRRKNPLLAIGDTDEQKAEFHAFICFEDEDSEFVKEMIYECETKADLKLCLDVRDLLAGQNEQYVTAEMIKARCNRTIVIVSQAFNEKQSEMSVFALRVAQSLSPAASRSKMIPVKINECEMPNSLIHITPVDYTRCRERSWLWRKVVATLRTQQDNISFVEKQKLRHLNMPLLPVPDLRTAMKEESYEPPEFPPYVPKTKPYEHSKSSSSRSSGASGQSPESRITDTSNLSKKEKLKQSIKNFFSSKTR